MHKGNFIDKGEKKNQKETGVMCVLFVRLRALILFRFFHFRVALPTVWLGPEPDHYFDSYCTNDTPTTYILYIRST